MRIPRSHRNTLLVRDALECFASLPQEGPGQLPLPDRWESIFSTHLWRISRRQLQPLPEHLLKHQA